MKKVLFTATVDSHILHFHVPFLKLFKEKGYEVHVATNGKEKIPYCDVKHIIPIERSPYSIKNLRAIKQLNKIINEEKFDIIHCHTPMGGVVTRLAAKKARKKYHTRVIYTAHGFHFYKGAPKKNWVFYYPVEKYLAKYTDTLITINKEDYVLACKKFSRRCKNIEYVPGVGIDESKFDFKLSKKEKSDLRKSLGLKDSDFVMIYPARLDKNKNQIFLINCMEQLVKKHSNIHLLLPGEDELNGYYQKVTKEKGLDHNIHFLGYRNDVPRLLKISDLAVSSSLREGLPVNILEAICSGLPVVALECRGVTDIIHSGKNGYLKSMDSETVVEDFTKAILKCISRNVIQETSKTVEKMSLDNISKRMETIYFRKPGIAFLRSTSIYNDSRATKEINSYAKHGNRVLALGWNRNLEKIILKNDGNKRYYFLNYKASYGSGIKNIFKMLKFNKWLYNQLKANINDIDIIHACDFDTAYVAKKISKKHGKRLIYDVYDYYVDCHNLGFLKPLVEKIDLGIMNYADYVLICTEKRREQIIKAHPKNIVVIHNSPEYISVTPKVRKRNRNINVGYFGILQDDRLLIEISKSIIREKNIIFHVGGFGKYEQYFSDLSKEYSNIKYYGALPYSGVLKKEMECDILFATYNPEIKNHKYSAPNKVYEAMALGKSIIVCNGTGIDDLVTQENIGTAIDYDANQFIKAVKELYIKRNVCNTVFEEKYSWNVMEKKLIKLLESLIY